VRVRTSGRGGGDVKRGVGVWFLDEPEADYQRLQPIAPQMEGAPTGASRWKEKAAPGIMRKRGGLESRPFSILRHTLFCFLMPYIVASSNLASS
jgi:hypothetical protein